MSRDSPLARLPEQEMSNVDENKYASDKGATHYSCCDDGGGVITKNHCFKCAPAFPQLFQCLTPYALFRAGKLRGVF